MACIDQDKESDYNTLEFKAQKLEAEELDAMLGRHPRARERDEAYDELLKQIIDLPTTLGQQIYLGGDIGLVNDPTVFTLWAIGPQG
jgi:hypothetical protein